MRGRALPFVVAVLLSRDLHAQIITQQTPPPPVTAESASWYLSGEPILWNGERFYRAGTARPFNPYEMTRSGSCWGVPLYTDKTSEPNSVILVPLSGGRVQPYERPRTGALAGTVGSRASSFPPEPATAATQPGGLNQAAVGPTQALELDVCAPPEPATPRPIEPTRFSTATGTAGTTRPSTAGTSGRARPGTTLRQPTGLNKVWIAFGGHRWVAEGKSIPYDAASLMEIGKYHGWSVYTRTGDRSTIYIPGAPGRLVQYKQR